MTNNTQLPAEVLQRINDDSLKEYPYKEGYDTSTPGLTQLIDVNTKNRKVWREGATEYATKLHACDKANSALEEKVRGLDEWNKEARTLLEKFISRHEAGLLPDRGIYNDIKSFLDGEE